MTAFGVLSMFSASSTAAQWRLQSPVDEPSSYSTSIRLWLNFSRSIPQCLHDGCLVISSDAAKARDRAMHNTAATAMNKLFFMAPPRECGKRFSLASDAAVRQQSLSL